MSKRSAAKWILAVAVVAMTVAAALVGGATLAVVVLAVVVGSHEAALIEIVDHLTERSRNG